MRQWKKQKEYEERYTKRFRALAVGVVRGQKVQEDWLPNFGGVWSTGSRQESRAVFREETIGKKVLGPESCVSDLASFVSSGGAGLSEDAKKRVLEESKRRVFAKIQQRMH